MWETNRLLVVYFNKVYPLEKIHNYRFTKEALLAIALNVVTYALFIGVMMLVDPSVQPRWVFLLFGMLDRLIYGLLIAGFYEMLLFVQALRKVNQEKEQLRKLNVTIQLESLKNQVKPHFLFNSLNTLTALVENEPAQAVQFIAQLSTVYRYLLQSNDKELIGLQQEIQFTQAYFFLLQMRFGEGVVMKLEINEQFQQHSIPPLTLQMLVENAIKHNQVSIRKPLEVKIWIEESGWLVVQNNLQLKRNASSTGTGLSNIAAKFKLLNQPDLQIMNDGQFFTIKVPLIKLPQS
jgi:LytS/YehU family sensor histidine kinase